MLKEDTTLLDYIKEGNFIDNEYVQNCIERYVANMIAQESCSFEYSRDNQSDRQPGQESLPSHDVSCDKGFFTNNLKEVIEAVAIFNDQQVSVV